MADAGRSTRIDKDDTPKDAPPGTRQSGRKPGDARRDRQQQKRNREQMKAGVADDHRTQIMREKKRGTFP